MKQELGLFKKKKKSVFYFFKTYNRGEEKKYEVKNGINYKNY